MERLDELREGTLLPDPVHSYSSAAIREMEELLKTASSREIEIALEFVRSLTRR